MARRILFAAVVIYLAALVAVAVWAPELLGEAADQVALAIPGTLLASPVIIEAVLWGLLFFGLGILVAVLFRAGGRWLAFAFCIAFAAAVMFGQLLFRPAGSEYGFNLLGAIVGSAIGVLVVAVIAAIRGRGRSRTV